MKRILKGTALGFFCFSLLYAGAALDLSAVSINQGQVAQNGVPVYLRSDGGHLDFLFPARHPLQDWTQVFSVHNMQEKDINSMWIGIGWGEKGFYLDSFPSAFPNPVTTFRAATGLNKAVLQITYGKQPVINDTCRFLYASAEQYKSLTRVVLQSLVAAPNGKPQWIAAPVSRGPAVSFYEARGTYCIFNTCNTWVNSALRTAGMKACLWTPLARAVLDKYPLQNRKTPF